jgi:N6-L-threonylcarbamoyladenine synthase
MPCFLAGKLAAQAFSAALGVRLYEFSHQAGHVAAALYDTGLDELFEREFLALHFSGGTTQCLRVLPGLKIETAAETLDLNAGQVVDRVGAALGLEFPAGPALEQLAAGAKREYPVKLAFKGANCCLSGVENQCKALLENGAVPADIALFCLRSIEAAASGMVERVLGNYPGLKVVCAGGVMGNAIIRESLSAKFGAAFASPEFSADNAAGMAVLCARMEQNR